MIKASKHNPPLVHADTKERILPVEKETKAEDKREKGKEEKYG